MRLLMSFCLMALPTALWADTPEIVRASAQKSGDTWNFSVTLRHGDTGWDNYADGWEVLDPSGERLGYRELFHPHVNEQPFTRSLGGVSVPADLDHVLIRARDNVTGWGEETFRLDLP